MNWGRASYQILKPSSRAEGIELLRFIESAARISHRTEDKQTDESWMRFLDSVVLTHGDWSVVEHACGSVDFIVNRGVTHEFVRHRLTSPTQESTRFVNYSKPANEAFYIPSVGVKEADLMEWLDDLTAADAIYRKWLARGYAPQIARDHLPNALGAKIRVTCNLREWRHIFLARTSKETHPDFRQIMISLLGDFQARVPILYDDIVPESRQIDNFRLAG